MSFIPLILLICWCMSKYLSCFFQRILLMVCASDCTMSCCLIICDITLISYFSTDLGSEFEKESYWFRLTQGLFVSLPCGVMATSFTWFKFGFSLSTLLMCKLLPYCESVVVFSFGCLSSVYMPVTWHLKWPMVINIKGVPNRRSQTFRLATMGFTCGLTLPS